MKFIGLICLLSLVTTVSAAGSDIYRYTDRHGNVIYTDDINKVPDAQRAHAGVSEDESPMPPGPEASAAPPQSGSVSKDAMEALKVEKDRLEALKSILKQEYNSLVEENARLKAAQKTAVTPGQRKAYNKEVVNFNARFQAYKEKEAAYESRLEKYNNRSNSATSDHPSE